MIRSPYRHGIGRGSELDAGGVADLQTDVMRFMAILAICLVVIFALVQSIPLTAEQQPTVEANPPPPPPEPEAKPAQEPAPQMTAAAADPVPEPLPEPLPTPPPEPELRPEQLTRPQPASPAPAPVAEDVAPAPPADAQQGFTLQFESDTALTRLVARNEVGLYAIATDKSLRMNVNRGRFSFWPASTPNEFHEMEVSTVPADVMDALHRSQGHHASVQWAVTLPANMQQQLNDILRSTEGGTLLIAGDGQLRLEQ